MLGGIMQKQQKKDVAMLNAVCAFMPSLQNAHVVMLDKGNRVRVGGLHDVIRGGYVNHGGSCSVSSSPRVTNSPSLTQKLAILFIHSLLACSPQASFATEPGVR
jgi:hypothetical protein